jgi:hypothetical protein
MYTYQGKVIRAGRGWVDSDGVKHPSNWMNWDNATKTEKGLVWVDDPAPFDNRFYWSAGNPKAIDDVTETDEAGNVSVTKGLKSVAIEQTKATAGSLLAPTDWYIVREQETGDTTPVEVLAYRQAVREASGDIEAAIVGVTTHEAFMALYNAPVDAEGNVTGNAPINDWPEA